MYCIEAKVRIDIPLQVNSKYSEIIRADEKITLTKGRDEEYTLWHNTGIYDLPKEYVGETVRVVSED